MTREEAFGLIIRRDALRVYIEECSEGARQARQRGDSRSEDWWLHEELEARGALLEVEGVKAW